uniref:BHLH domain-containing protein n=1 Tax=Ananas comosus var. bracteatus TaxID=296719 RepID=A0A6V7Q5W9_ANACO|nr:unnamed protein product [Ananas comosus var. bracteatus]
MALAKEQAPKESTRPHSIYDTISLELFGYKGHRHTSSLLNEVSYCEGLPPILADTSNSSSSASFALGVLNSPPQEAHSGLSSSKTKSDGCWAYSTSSVLSFDLGDQFPHSSYANHNDQEEECDVWINAMDQNHTMNQSSFEYSWIVHDHSYETRSAAKDDAYGEEQFALLHPSSISMNGAQEVSRQDKLSQKRPYAGDHEMPTPKKQRGINRNTKTKPTPPKDPQSVAAKVRRERISERLKILQDLVPNGTKVDLVTMLEKAINYVKFLQLQVKVLSTDEFWPAQGGKVPDISQVREAIDAILCSQRDMSSNSKK